jgi:hypothetical protein
MTIVGSITVRSSFGHVQTLASSRRGPGPWIEHFAGVDHAIAAFEAGVSLDATPGDETGQCHAPRWKSRPGAIA